MKILKEDNKMSKNWYPVINYELCTNCGSCVNMCKFGVYDKTKYPEPKVVYPEGCIEGCNGCGNLCPNEAIKYHSDMKKSCGCNCSCGDSGCC